MQALRQVRPGSTGTNLNDAMLLAADMIVNEKGRLVVISDFSGQDITYAQKTIEAKNIPVEYRQVGEAGKPIDNAGIIEAAVEENNVRFSVKNYNDAPKDVVIRILHGDSEKSINRTIRPGSRELFVVPDLDGTATVSLGPQDELPADDTLYISMPGPASRRVLLLTDSVKKGPVSIAFNSIPGLTVHEVPFIRAPRKMDYALVVLYNYTSDSLLPGTLDDLRTYVDEGGTLVFVADDGLQSMDTRGLLPVEVSGMAGPSRFEVKKTGLTEGVDLGISRYLKGELKEGAAGLAAAPEGPILAYWNTGKGKVIYLGINERWGDFHLDTSYPIFWLKLLEFANPGGEELNFKTGTLLRTDAERPGPDSTVRTGDLYLDEAGFYKIGDRTIAANLLDEKESDISIRKIDHPGNEKAFGESKEKIHPNTVLSLIAIILVALELYYLKQRGDL